MNELKLKELKYLRRHSSLVEMARVLELGELALYIDVIRY